MTRFILPILICLPSLIWCQKRYFRNPVKHIEKVMQKEWEQEYTPLEGEWPCYYSGCICDTATLVEEHPADLFVNTSDTVENTATRVWKGQYMNPGSIHNREESGLTRWITAQPITNAEYREFVHWVRDSIARRIIANTWEPDDESDRQELILDLYDSTYLLKDCLGFSSIDTDRAPLDWSWEFSYDDPQFIPLLAEMYRPQRERFYRVKEFATEKFIYDYFWVKKERPCPRGDLEFEDMIFKGDINLRCPPRPPRRKFEIHHERVPIYPDSASWRTTPRPGWERIMAFYERLYTWHPAFSEEPVAGISAAQATAFCNWKERKLNSQLPKLSRALVVRLPNPGEVSSNPKVPVDSVNVSPFYRIDSSRYYGSMIAFKDSSGLIFYEETTIPPITYVKQQLTNPHTGKQIRPEDMMKRAYGHERSLGMTETGELAPDHEPGRDFVVNDFEWGKMLRQEWERQDSIERRTQDSIRNAQREERNRLNGVNGGPIRMPMPGVLDGVATPIPNTITLVDLPTVILHDTTTINYFQALAYYIETQECGREVDGKRRRKLDMETFEKETILNLWLPSPDEWLRIQRGEPVWVKMEVPLPGPVFRYVVEVE